MNLCILLFSYIILCILPIKEPLHRPCNGQTNFLKTGHRSSSGAMKPGHPRVRFWVLCYWHFCFYFQSLLTTVKNMLALSNFSRLSSPERIHNGSKKTCVTTQNVFFLCNQLHNNLSYQVDNNALVLIFRLDLFRKKYCLIHTNVLKVTHLHYFTTITCATFKIKMKTKKTT